MFEGVVLRALIDMGRPSLNVGSTIPWIWVLEFLENASWTLSVFIFYSWLWTWLGASGSCLDFPSRMECNLELQSKINSLPLSCLFLGYLSQQHERNQDTGGFLFIGVSSLLLLLRKQCDKSLHSWLPLSLCDRNADAVLEGHTLTWNCNPPASAIWMPRPRWVPLCPDLINKASSWGPEPCVKVNKRELELPWGFLIVVKRQIRYSPPPFPQHWRGNMKRQKSQIVELKARALNRIFKSYRKWIYPTLPRQVEKEKKERWKRCDAL